MRVTFEKHHSIYWGDPYYLSVHERHGELKLTENHDPRHGPRRDPPEDHYFQSQRFLGCPVGGVEAGDAAELAPMLTASAVTDSEVVPD